MRNAEIAAVLERIARLLEATGGNAFKVRAHERAARLIASLDRPVADLHTGGGLKALTALPGIGEGIAGKIAELLESGRCRELEALRAKLPPGFETLLDVPGMGPKTALLVAKRLKIRDLQGLEAALRDGRVAALPRLGEKTAAKLLAAVRRMQAAGGRLPLGAALPLADAIVGALASLPGAPRVALAGSARRAAETVGDLDVLCAPRDAAGGRAAMDRFCGLPGVAEIVARGTTKASIRFAEGLEADLRVVAPEAFGAALHYFTGSKAHNVRVREMGVKRGLKINEYGVWRGPRRIGGAEEEDVFRAVGLPWIPPELREDAGEIEAAAAGTLPRLLDAADLRGDLHLHSDWSDGQDPLKRLAEAGRALGYEYLAVCDHSQSLKMARGLSVEELRRKNREIDRLNRGFRGFRLLKGAEVDILADGSLDYPDAVLDELEVVVASVHTRFTLPEAEQTRRMVRAVRHPKVTVLAHPTGRLVGRRDPYPVDLEEVVRAAAGEGTAIELNAQPERLDLAERALRRARDAGATFAVNSDAHTAGQLRFARLLGAPCARRAWIGPDAVLNALPLDRLLKRLGR